MTMLSPWSERWQALGLVIPMDRLCRFSGPSHGSKCCHTSPSGGEKWGWAGGGGEQAEVGNKRWKKSGVVGVFSLGCAQRHHHLSEFVWGCGLKKAFLTRPQRRGFPWADSPKFSRRPRCWTQICFLEPRQQRLSPLCYALLSTWGN